MTGCASKRSLTTEHNQESRVERVERHDSVDTERVEVYDTLKEVTTITVQVNESGDTLRQSIVTDRLHSRTRDRIQKTDNNTITTNDSTFFQRDSIAKEETNQTTGTLIPGSSSRLIPGLTRNPNDAPRASIFRGILKWTFWIIIAVTVLLIVIRILRH